jgi:hypothetical protein
MENEKKEDVKAEPDKIERAELAVKKMEEAEKRLDEKIAKLQELEVNRLLGSTAGGRVESQPKVETAKEYSDRVMKNTIPAKKND